MDKVEKRRKKEMKSQLGYHLEGSTGNVFYAGMMGYKTKPISRSSRVLCIACGAKYYDHGNSFMGLVCPWCGVSWYEEIH